MKLCRERLFIYIFCFAIFISDAVAGDKHPGIDRYSEILGVQSGTGTVKPETEPSGDGKEVLPVFANQNSSVVSGKADPLTLKYENKFKPSKDLTRKAVSMDTFSRKYQNAFSGSNITYGGKAFENNLNSSPPLKKFAPDESEYTIGSGDILDISVWKAANMSRIVTVLPDGIVSLPLIGEMRASGKKLNELKEEIEERLSHYMPAPVLSISVHQVNSMMIYIIGKVNNPGRFNLNTNVNVLQALSMAGGLNPFASSDKIKIFRNKDMFPFKYKEVSEGINLSQNILLKRGDVIVIP